jgi:hypothetical protein
MSIDSKEATIRKWIVPLAVVFLVWLGGCSPTNGFGQFVETRLFIMYPRAPARMNTRKDGLLTATKCRRNLRYLAAG